MVSEHACTAVVDGGGAMGQVGMTFATRLAMKRAHVSGIATVVLRNTSHLGRVGAYPLMIAREGMIGQIFVNAGRLGYQIAIFSLNPFSIASVNRYVLHWSAVLKPLEDLRQRTHELHP